MRYFLFIISFSFSIFLTGQNNDVEIIDNAIKIVPDERVENMQFGWSIDVQSDFVFVGAPIYSNKVYQELGSVFIFKRNDKGFIETHQLASSQLKNNMSYGKNVKILNNIFIASSGGENEITTIKNNSIDSNNNVYGSIDVMMPLDLLRGKAMKSSKIVHKDTKKRDVRFADEIDISEKYLVTSLPFYPNENATTGKVVIYKFIFIKDVHFKLVQEIIPPENTFFFGQSIAIYGNDIIVGATNEVFIYTITDSTAQLATHLKRKNSINFGSNVAIVNNYAFVSNRNNIPPYFGYKIPNTDSVFSLVMLNENGGATQVLIPNNANEKQKYGITDELFRQEAIPIYDSITAYKQLENSEEVVVYKKTNNNEWEYHQTLYSNKRTPFEFFGSSIDAKDSVCVVGAFSSPISYEFNNMNAYAGAAFVFELQKDGFWKLTKKLVPKEREYWQKFGFSVATDGKSVVVGSRFDNTDENYDNYINNAGAVYFYSIKK